jgi:aminoglycoside phosphotransferase (APT) family kinase protein
LSTDVERKSTALITELGLGTEADVEEVRPLSGGVASDIAIVRLPDKLICVKFALPKLKVAADWRAPVHRNAAEYAWLQIAAQLMPESAVRLYGRSEALHGFAMEFLDGPDVYLWKAALLAEAPGRGEAERVADLLGRIHAASAEVGFDSAAFENRDDFRALRIEPYLGFAAGQHPALGSPLEALTEMLYESRQVLVHGDVSPKNILFRSGGPVLLDAECATMGDASFDPSFCLNHLVLKAVHLPGSRDRLLADIGRFWRRYAAHVSWERQAALEGRVCRLVPALMLGRIDGKSPIEYLGAAERELVRDLAAGLIRHPEDDLSAFIERLESSLKGLDS